MEDTSQQGNQELEYKTNEDQGGIRRRLRDRDLLKKRKAEVEEKETNQVESQRKRRRGEDKSGAKKRGRPRKTEPTAEISVVQEDASAPAVIVLPEPAQVTPDQAFGSLTPVLAGESQPVPVSAAPAPQLVFGSAQNPLFPPSLTSPTQVYPTPVLFSPSVLAPPPAKVLDTAPIPIRDVAPAPDPVPIPAPVAAADPAPPADPTPPAAPTQVETLNIDPQDKEALDPVQIEDLGPNEEEDIPVSQNITAEADLSGTSSNNAPEQNKMFSIPTLSSPPPPQEYLPGNSF